MNVVPDKGAFFDEEATLAMVAAFELSCSSLRRFARQDKMREIIAKRIVDAAKNGERDPARLHEQALVPFGIEDMSMVFVSVGRDPPVPAYALVTHAA
jgi:hypothetical protein